MFTVEPCLSVCLSVVTLTQSFLIGFLPNFTYGWLLPSTSQFNFKYRFRPTSNNQDGRQNAPHLSIFAVVVTLTQSVLIGLLPTFMYELLPSTYLSLSNMGFVWHLITKNNGRQNGRRLSMSTVVVTLSHFVSDIFQISYMDCFHQTLIQVWLWVLSEER